MADPLNPTGLPLVPADLGASSTGEQSASDVQNQHSPTQQMEPPTTDQPIPESLPEQATPPPSPVQDEYRDLDPNRHVLAFIGDQQYNVIPYQWVAVESSALNTRTPATRSPGANIAVPMAHETMIRDSIPEELRPYFEGMISTGDNADTSSTEEIAAFLFTLERLKRADPANRVLSLMVGNHECLSNGVARSGTNFFGVLGLVLNLQGRRSFGTDIHGPQVGGADNQLDKEKYIEMIYDYLFDDEKSDPEKKLYQERAVPLEHSGSDNYRLTEDESKQWNDTETVFNDFWKQEKDGTWNLLVHYKPQKDRPIPEKTWLYTSAVKLADLENDSGNYPVYFVGLDTMDYLRSTQELGALSGHISPEQVKMLKAFVSHMKAQNPNAKFIFGGHFAITSMADVESSGLNELLSDSAVISYIGAHTHKRNYIDLSDTTNPPGLFSASPADKYGIKRETPLPEITVPAVIDYPNEFVILDYGIDKSDPQKLYFEYSFQGIDPSAVPGNSPEVQKELEIIRPYLLTQDDGIEHIDDPQLREFASPTTSIKHQLYLALSLDRGMLTRAGHIHEFIVAHDTIKLMVEDAQFYIRLFTSTVKLSLMEAGLNEEASTYEKLVLGKLELLNSYYEKMIRGDYTKLGHYHDDENDLDQFDRELDLLTYQIHDIITQAPGAKSVDPKFLPMLEGIDHIAGDLKTFVDDYRHWLQTYEGLLRTERSDSDMMVMATVFQNSSFRALTSHIQAIPHGSQAYAFLTVQLLESTKQDVQFYKATMPERFPGEVTRNVPDIIRVEVSTTDGSIQISPTPPKPLTDEEMAARQRSWGDPPRGPDQQPILFDKPSFSPFIPYNQPEWHWSLRWGPYGGKGHSTWNWADATTEKVTGGNSGYRLDAGGQWHMLDKPGAPRLNTGMMLGWNRDWQTRFEETARNDRRPLRSTSNEFSYKQSFTLGDRLGLVDVGPLGMGGIALREPIPGNPNVDDFSDYAVPFVGVGGQMNILEGALTLEGANKWYFNDPTLVGSQHWYLGASTDLLTWLRLTEQINRKF